MMVASDYPTKLGVQMIQLNKLCKLTAYNVSFKINLTSSCDILKFFRDNCSRLHNPGKRRYPQIGRTAQSFHPKSGQGLSGICFLRSSSLVLLDHGVGSLNKWIHPFNLCRQMSVVKL